MKNLDLMESLRKLYEKYDFMYLCEYCRMLARLDFMDAVFDYKKYKEEAARVSSACTTV